VSGTRGLAAESTGGLDGRDGQGVSDTVSTRSQPNILFILSDQHRWSALNCYGNSQVIAPAFDRMAGQGVRFTHALSGCPVCAPARTSLQTGLHAHQHNVRGNVTPWVGQHFRSLADYFNTAGYETCFIGKAHWGRGMFYDMKWKGGYVAPERRLRWKHWLSTEGHRAYDSVVYDDAGQVLHDAQGRYENAFQTDLACDFIRRCEDRPWLVHLDWGAPHTLQPGSTVQYGPAYFERGRQLNRELGFNLPDELFVQQDPCLKLLMPQALQFDIVPQRFLDLYDPDDLKVDPNVPEQWRTIVRYHLREYYAMISSLDEDLARIFAFLQESGHEQDTLVVYTSDHGDRIAAHCTLEKFRTKSSPHQNSVRVPLLVWGPALGVGQGKVNSTPFGLVDIFPTLLDCIGAPLDPHLPGRSLKECFMGDTRELQRTVLLSLDPWRAVCDGRYLYAIRGEADSWSPIHLIDMQQDPYDMHDLMDDPQIHPVRERLHAELVRQLIATSDHEFVLRTGLKARELF
jgi:arylsulfatase A-like enzyme